MSILDTIQAIYGAAHKERRITPYTVWRISLPYADEMRAAFKGDWVPLEDTTTEPTLMGLPILWDTRPYMRIIALEELPKIRFETTQGTATERKHLEPGWADKFRK